MATLLMLMYEERQPATAPDGSFAAYTDEEREHDTQPDNYDDLNDDEAVNDEWRN